MLQRGYFWDIFLHLLLLAVLASDGVRRTVRKAWKMVYGIGI